MQAVNTAKFLNVNLSLINNAAKIAVQRGFVLKNRIVSDKGINLIDKTYNIILIDPEMNLIINFENIVLVLYLAGVEYGIINV